MEFRWKPEIIKPLIRLGYPVVAANIGLVVMSLVDNAMVGVLGYVPLAASGISNAIFFVASVFGMGVLAVYSANMASTLKNKRNDFAPLVNANHAVAFLVATFTYVVLLLLTINFKWFGQSPEVETAAIPYLKTLANSVWPMFIYLAFKNVTDGHSKTLPAMFATLSAVLLNIFLNWLLIYGNWGFKAYGLVGAGYATLISRWYMAAVMMGFVFIHPRIQYSLNDVKVRFSNNRFVELLRLGIPSGLQFFYEVSAFAAAAVMAGWLGAKYLAAHQIAIGLASFTYMVANGISVASMIKIGETVLSSSRSRLRDIGNQSILLTVVMMMIFALCFVLFRTPLAAFFTFDPEVIKIAAELMLLAAFFQLFDGVQAVSLGLLRGMGDTRIPSRLALMTYWGFALPVSYVLGFHTQLGMYGIWIGLTVGLMLAAFFLYRRFLHLTFDRL